MTAHARYPPTHEQLLELAREAKREGLSFAAFWQRAMRPGRTAVTWAVAPERRPEGCVIWPRDTTDRNISIAATLGAREGWRRSYQGLPPTRTEAALARLQPMLAELATATADGPVYSSSALTERSRSGRASHLRVAA